MQFVFDLDGTLVFDGQKISERLTNALLNLEDAGHTITFASARSIRDMLPVIDSRLHHTRLIGANGAVVWEEEKLRRYVEIDRRTFEDITHILTDIHATYLVDGYWDYTIIGDQNHPFIPEINILKHANHVDVSDLSFISKILVLQCGDPTKLLEKIPTMNVARHRHRDEARFDITSKNVNKHLGFSSVCAEEFVVFGNDLNDLALFKSANHGVIVGDFPPLHIHAHEQIRINRRTEDSLIEVIEKLSKKFPL